MKKKYTDRQLLTRFKSLPSYRPERGIPKRLIIAVRSAADTPNVFDDKIYPFIDGVNKLVTTCTTNPGVPILTGGFKKYNPKGAAILKDDEIYYDVYRKSNGKNIPHHNGKMPCFRQMLPMKYFRDGDGDNKSEQQGTPEVANNSTNIHFNSYTPWQVIKSVVSRVSNKIITKVTNIIGGWSAGCQVLNVEEDYFEMYDMYDDEPITYCLLKEFDV